MRFAIFAATIIVFALAAPRAAIAAATGRLSVYPAQPRVGEVTTFEVRPFWTYVDHLEPAAFPDDYPWRVAAFTPRGHAYAVAIRKTADDPYGLSGTFRFRSPGTWTICVLNFQTFPYARSGCSIANPTRQRLGVLPRYAGVSTWHYLERRPLHIPGLATGEACPTTEQSGVLAASGIEAPFDSFPAWGSGPAFPTALGRGPRPLLTFEYPPLPGSVWEGSGWGGRKNIWVVADSYRGPVLVRGRQLDGPNDVRFENGRPGFTDATRQHPRLELRLLGPETHGNPATTRLRAPGCYAFQVDGAVFSYLIVFEARIEGA
ncbi:MAG: hypothetical protein H0W90_10535 [Actinobacteria bacterium]|nr:hypothetical protein [Actinomycetota bacterium]